MATSMSYKAQQLFCGLIFSARLTRYEHKYNRNINSFNAGADGPEFCSELVRFVSREC